MFSKLTAAAWEFAKFVIITLAIVLPIRTFVAQPFIVNGASMYPTFTDREYLIVDELSYLLREPRRGEVIVFRYPRDPKKHFIKRVIGLPGETVRVIEGEIFVRNAGEEITLQEPYAQGETGPNFELTLGPDEYFVLGDNRMMSLDSRSFGALPERLISGRTIFRLFPFNRLEVLPGSASYSN